MSSDATWLTLDTTTGQLSGTPTVSDLGEYTITLSLTVGAQTLTMNPFEIVVTQPTTLQPGTESIASTLTDNDVPNTLNQFTNTVSVLNSSTSDPEGVIVDTTAPQFTDLSPITLFANGYLTSLKEHAPSVSDNITTMIDAKLISPQSGYPSGEHLLIWEATDEAGHITFAEQTIYLYSTPSFANTPMYLPEGEQSEWSLRFNGITPTPLTIDITLHGLAEAGIDHTLMSGAYTLEKGSSALRIPFATLADDLAEDDEWIRICADIKNDKDYLPDYLDLHNKKEILSMGLQWPHSFLIEAPSGLSLKLGRESILLDTFGAYISPEHYDRLMNQHNYPDQTFEAGDTVITLLINDFGLPGSTASFSLPLQAPLTLENAVSIYHPNSGWSDFIDDNRNNNIRATQGIQAVCPEPQRYHYRSSLKPGDHCLMIEIEDGGPNDSDGSINGLISVMLAVESNQSAQILADATSPIPTALSNTQSQSQSQPQPEMSAKGGGISMVYLLYLIGTYRLLSLVFKGPASRYRI